LFLSLSVPGARAHLSDVHHRRRLRQRARCLQGGQRQAAAGAARHLPGARRQAARGM